jgi:hypothetical protein
MESGRLYSIKQTPRFVSADCGLSVAWLYSNGALSRQAPDVSI